MVESLGSNSASVQSILNNIRQIREGFNNIDANGGKFEINNTEDEQPFQMMLSNAIKSVSDTQLESTELKNRFEMGDPNVSLEQVTIASQRASIGFEATLQIRNKLVEAYKDIMNMPV